MNKAAVLLLIGCLLLDTAFAGWQPEPDDSQQVEARQTMDALLEHNPALQRYFDEAAGMAVFPNIAKAAAMFGVTYGRGIVIAGDEVVGTCWQTAVDLGPQLGAKWHAQIIFFRDAAALAEFQKGRLEFNGKAGISVATVGYNATPAHLPDVAIATITRAGLIAEAAAGPTLFGYKPLPE